MNALMAGPTFLEKAAFIVFAVSVLGGALVTITRKSAVAALVAVSENVNGWPIRASVASEMVPLDSSGFG